MTIRHVFVLFLLLSAVNLVACRPTVETGPVVSVPTESVSTAVPTSGPPAATATAETAVTTEPETASGQADAFCPEITRPAMLLFLPEDDYALFDPASGQACPLPADPVPGLVAMVQNDLFLASRTAGPEGGATVIQRYLADGTVEELPATMVDTQAGTELVAFTLSNNARMIAWSVLGPAGGSDLPSPSLSIADLETGQVLGGVAPEVGEAPLALEPIRFSEDGSTLYYTLQPYGIGGMWQNYVGRSHNLYAVSTDGSGTPRLIFDCADLGLGLCLGDFFLVGSTVTALAYVDGNAGTVVIQNGEGNVLNTLKAEEEYIGYPTWGPGGEFIYYTADLSPDANASPAPEMGYLHRVAPTTAPAETVASDPALLLPVRFLNDTQVVVNWLSENDNWGLALVGVDGSVQVLDVPAGASLLGVPAHSTLLGAIGGPASAP